MTAERNRIVTRESASLAIRFSQTRDPERPCALCRAPHRLWTGPVLVVEGTSDPVCDDCGDQYEPGLTDLVRAAAHEWGGVVIGEHGELTVDELLTGQRGDSNAKLAAKHADMIHVPADEETFAALRLLERKLVQRGRVDVLFADGIWEITKDDSEYVRNEIVRAAYHKHAGVVELDRLDLPSTTLCDVGMGGRLFMLGDVDIQLPVACEVCTEPIYAPGPYYLTCTHEDLVCVSCVDRYELAVGGPLQFETHEEEVEFRRATCPPGHPGRLGLP